MSPRRVLLVSPPYEHTPGPFARLAPFAEPPLGLASLAAAIRAADCDAVPEILDAAALGLGPDGLVRAIVERQPDVAGFSTTTSTLTVTRHLLRRLRPLLPDGRFVVGGSHPSARPEDLLPDADQVVMGEGEVTLVELLEGRAVDEIPGVAFMDGARPRINPPRALVPHLDDLAPPAYDLLPGGRYSYPYPVRRKRGRYSTMITSRGCPGRCTFCAKDAIWGAKVRFHSLDRVMEVIETLVRRDRVTLLYLYDDTLLANRRRTRALAERIADSFPDLRWVCQARVSEVDDEICRVLAGSGCVKLEIGVESGASEVLEEIRKPVDPTRVRGAFAAARRAGIQTKANFIFGFPNETADTIERTIALAVEAGATYANFFNLVPFPGTALFERYREEGFLLADDWDRFSYHGRPLVAVPGASAEVLARAKREALRRFYLRPGKLFELGGVSLLSRDLGALVRGLFGMLNELAP